MGWSKDAELTCESKLEELALCSTEEQELGEILLLSQNVWWKQGLRREKII